jgi:hypothetical protein
MSGGVDAQRTADALGIFNSPPQFLSNERREIEVLLPDEAEDDVESGPDGVPHGWRAARTRDHQRPPWLRRGRMGFQSPDVWDSSHRVSDISVATDLGNT